MKIGLSLTELAKEIERRKTAKADFVAPASKLEMAVGRDNKVVLKLWKDIPSAFPINSVAHEQIADYVGIPMPYYRRMLNTVPDLLVNNVNRWLYEKASDDGDGDRRMIRTLDGNVRAVLSEKYRPLENEDLAEAVLPVLMEKDLLIMSCDVTPTRMYIKAVDKRIEKDVPTGKKMGDSSGTVFDTVSPAITISNSEVGRGALLIETGIYTRACTNLSLFGTSMRKFHTGSRAELSDDVFALLTDQTRRLTDAAIWMQTRDLVSSAFDGERFAIAVDSLTEAAGDRFPKKADVVKVIERVGKRFGLADSERRGVLQCLIEDGNLTRYGVHSAITRFSQDVNDYDRATELERMGAKVIELPRYDWQQLAAAA